MKNISFKTDVLPLKNELFRLALRITGNRADAEDVVQETMLKVWSRREQWLQIDSITAFCLTVCRNLSLDKIRRMDSQTLGIEGTGETADSAYTANPERMTVDRDRVALVRRLIAQLPEKQRTAMQMRDVDGKSYRDIAEVMGISEEQVKVSIFRARQTVRKEYRKYEEYGL